MAQSYPLPEAVQGNAQRFTLPKLIGWVLISAACIVLGITLAQALVVFARHVPLALNDPYTLNYGEGPLLDQAVRLARGENIYLADLSAPPYTITNYPPLYILVQVPFVQRVGPAFWYGRLISVVSAAAAALFLGLTVRAITKDWLAAFAAGLTLLVIPYISYWSIMARIDALALALSMAGLWVITRWYTRRWGIILAVLLLTAAAYTRQTYLLAAPLAGFAYVWGRGERFRALLFAVLLGCAVLGIFATMMVATRGGIFTHIITANVNTLNSGTLQHYVDELLANLPIFLAAGVVYLVLGLIRGRPAWWMIAPYCLGAAAVALTISKIGSDVNYLFELSAAMCFAAGGIIALLRRWRALWAVVLRAGALVVLALAVTNATALTTNTYDPILQELTRDLEKYDPLVELLRTTDVPIIADEQMGLMVLNGKPILMQPFEMTQLALAGLWDQKPFLDALARGDYPIVLLYQPYRNPQLRFERWTPEMLRIINNVFRPDFQTAETTVYRYAGS
jgi:4-amino-4-deoxy-L-arabinose transferase-like glycosyltransferase